LKSCVSHNGESRLTAADSVSTAAESDGRDSRRCQAGTGHRQQGHRDGCRGHRLDRTSNSTRLADGSLSSQSQCSKNHSRKYEIAGSPFQQRHDYGSRRRSVGQSSSSSRDTGRCRSTWSTHTARRRRATVHVDFRYAPLTVNIDDDDFITTSSENEDPPSTSTSSFTPANYIDDRASLLSCSTTSSSAAFTASPSCHRSLRQPTEPSFKGSSLHFFTSPRRHKSTGCSHSLSTSNNIDEDDDDLNRSKSSVEITVASRHLDEEVAGYFREDELRAVRSLFEFRSSDELRVANDFIDGVWRLYSRRSLYQERYVCSKPEPPTSTTPSSHFLFLGCSDKDFRPDVGCDTGEIVANDNWKSRFNDVTGSEQLSLRNRRNNQNVVNDDDGNRRLNFADVHCVSVTALEDWNGRRKEFQPLEMIEELSGVTATMNNEDEFTIHVRKSAKTYNDNPDATPGKDTEVPVAECRVPLPKLIEAPCDKPLENVAVLHALSHRRNKTDAISEKSSGLSTLRADLTANGPGVKTLMEATDSNSRFAAELIHVYDALLVRSGVGETASPASLGADIKMFQPLSAGVKDCPANKRPDASKCLQVDGDSFNTTTGDDFGSLSRTVISDKQADFNRNRYRKKTEREADILWRLTPRLLAKPRQVCDLQSTKPIDSMSCNAEDPTIELYSPKQLTCYETGCMTSTNSTQTNDFNDDLQSTAETRQRISRRSKGRGKVRELIKLFESSSASTLNSSASPIDVKRATISAAVSVGELLRRASEQEVASCGQNVRALLDVHAKQPTISSPKSTEALSSADFASTQAPHLPGDECLSTPEAVAVVHKSSARWPTMSRIRRKHARRHVHTRFVGGSAASRIDLDRLSEIHNSRSDARTSPANDRGENPSALDNNNISKTPKALPLWNENVKLRNDNSSECQDASTTHSAKCSLWTERPEGHSCDVTNVAANTSNLLTSSPVVVGDLPVVVNSTNFLSAAARQENVCQLPTSPSSSSSSSQRPSKSLHTCEVAVTANTFTPSTGGSGDVGGRHDKSIPASNEVNECNVAYFNNDVCRLQSTNCTAHGRTMIPPSGGLPRKQPVSAVTTEESKKTPSAEVATIDDCQRFNSQAWFISGGPRLVEVPRWLITSGKDVVAIVHRSKSRERRRAKATLDSETGCPAVYPVVRMTGVTVHLPNKVDVDNIHISERNGAGGAEYIVDASSRGGKRPRTQSIMKNTSSYEAVKRSRAVSKLIKGDQQLCEKSASENESVYSAAATKTTGVDDEFNVITSSGAPFRGRGDAKTHFARKHRDHQERDRNAVNSVTSSSRRSADATSGRCPCHALGDDPPSRRASSGKHSDTTSPTITSSTTQSPDGVTVVHSRRRSTSDQPSAVTFTTPSQVGDRTQPPATDSCKRLAQQFLLTSLLEYRLDALKKSNSRRSADVTPGRCPRHALGDDPPSRRSSSGKHSDTTSPTITSPITANCRLVSDEPIQSPDGVTVVYSRRRSTSDRSAECGHLHDSFTSR